MKERGINNTFKKIIFESSEMIFLADDTYPYNIFYTNQVFEDLIGQFLDERSLVGLGLDINAYIFNEELILPFMGVEYTFFLELPQENDSNYFLFYKGKEMRGQGLPTKKDSQYFFRNTVDLVGIGQESYLTWVSNSVKNLLGYSPEEITNIELCSFFHPEDLEKVKGMLFEVRQERRNNDFTARLLAKNGSYRCFEFHVHFIVGKFYAVGRDITDLQNQIVSKQALNELYHLGEKASNIGFYEILLPDHTVSFSDELHQIFGNKNLKNFTLEETINLFQPVDRPLIKSGLSDLLSSGKELNLSLKIKTAGEIVKWVKVTGRVHILSNKKTRIVGTVQDITVEQVQIHQLEMYQELFDATPDALWVTDVGGTVQLCNAQALSMYGVSEQKDFPTSLMGFESTFEAPESWENHVQQLTSEDSKIYHSEIKQKSGNFHPMEIHSKLIQIQGESYIVSNARKIDERTVYQNAVTAPSEMLSHLIEHIPGALYQFIIDKDGEMKFSYLSPGIMSLLDMGAEELENFKDIGKLIAKVHPEDIGQVLTTTVVSARKLSPWTCKFRIKEVLKNSYKWVQAAAKPQKLDNEDVVWYGYLTDITDQKAFEETLRGAKDEALNASKIKSEFLSIISHELRTPLNAISGSVYSLLQDEHTPVQESSFKTISFAVENLITMINDLLDFQKIEAGKLSLEVNPMNLVDLVRQVVNGLEYHAKDTGNKLSLKVKNDVAIDVKGDKVRLAQVLNNLITNALKFTNKGEVEVHLELKKDGNDKALVYFEVRDNGIGIAEEHQARIFNEFDQIQHSFSKKYGGTGLGLSITKKLLDLMDSKIALHSEVGVGSTFFFEVEFEKVFVSPSSNGKPKDVGQVSIKPIVFQLPNEEVLSSSLESSGIKKVDLKPKSLNEVNLLMAEDNDVNALVLGKIIKKWGINYHRVNNGKLAVEAAEKGTYDVILMDIQMPVMNGFEATEKIKEFTNVPVIALSAADKIEVMDRIDVVGFDGYVAKPIDAAELLKKIKELLGIPTQAY